MDGTSWFSPVNGFRGALQSPEQTLESQATSEDEQARLDGTRLAARALDHQLTNDLSLALGYAELLADDPELPQRLRDMAVQVREHALDAVTIVRRRLALSSSS